MTPNEKLALDRMLASIHSDYYKGILKTPEDFLNRIDGCQEIIDSLFKVSSK